MKNSNFAHNLTLTLAALFSLASFALFAVGLYQFEWWAGFGLVLFMTSLIILAGVKSPPIATIEPTHEQKRPAQAA